MKYSLVLLLAVFVSVSSGEEVSSAKLIVIKDITNDLVAQGMDLTIRYDIFNVGERLVVFTVNCTNDC